METIRARIFRFDPAVDERPRYDAFEVPARPHMRVLDVLDHIHETLACDIGYRWLCGVKRCGTCAVTVNGSPRLACWEAAEPEMTIEPLRNLPLVRDLVTDRGPYEALLAAIHPLLVREAEYPGFPEPLSDRDVAAARHLRECIQCLACTAACPVLAEPESGFAGPAPLVALAELALDPRDGDDRAGLAEAVAGVFKCVSCYECERVCPAEIPIVSEAIEPLKRLVSKRGGSTGQARAFLAVVEETGRANPAKLALRSQGLSARWLRLGVRMLRSGKLDLRDALLARPEPGAEAVRRLYRASRTEGDGE